MNVKYVDAYSSYLRPSSKLGSFAFSELGQGAQVGKPDALLATIEQLANRFGLIKTESEFVSEIEKATTETAEIPVIVSVNEIAYGSRYDSTYVSFDCVDSMERNVANTLANFIPLTVLSYENNIELYRSPSIVSNLKDTVVSLIESDNKISGFRFINTEYTYLWAVAIFNPDGSVKTNLQIITNAPPNAETMKFCFGFIEGTQTPRFGALNQSSYIQVRIYKNWEAPYPFTIKGMEKADIDASFGGRIDVSKLPGFSEGTGYIQSDGTPKPDSPPYTPGFGGGTASGVGGGGGSFNDDPGPSQAVPPGAAGVDISSTGMYNLYAPTLAEIQTFGGWLWSENFNLDSFKRLFTDPVSSILSFNRAPFSLDSVMTTSSAEIHFANLSSGVQSARLTQSNGQIDWGTVNIAEYWGGAMDYAPYTKISLYLPWGTGYVDLKISDVMKNSITVKTNIDAISGDCLHVVIDGYGRVIGQHRGNVYQDVPFSGGGGFLRAVGSGLMGGIVTAATGGAGAVASVGLETARAVAGADYTPSRGGGVGAAGALMGVQYPYIIIDRPIQSIPASFGRSRGYPSNITAMLGTLSGYTEIREIHLENIPATDAEMSEIESLLKSGVIL